MPVRGVSFCKVYDLARRGCSVFEVRHKDAPQSRAMQVHGGQCVTAHTDNKTTKETVQQLCMRKCAARLVCLSALPVDCQEIEFPASEMTSLNKEEKYCSVQDDVCHESQLRFDFKSQLCCQCDER